MIINLIEKKIYLSIPESLKKHTVIVEDTYTNRFIIGFEDRRRDNAICDHDFNDLLFIVTLNPKECADKTDSIPDLIDEGCLRQT